MTDDSRLTPNRDAALERLLQRMPAGSGEAGPCLEPETLASWMEGTLSAADRTIAEAHAAGCDRCQAMLAAMVRSEPPPMRPARWWSAGAIRWAVPLVAGAAVLALWVAIDPAALRSPAALPSAGVATPAALPAPVAGNQPAPRQVPLRSDEPTTPAAKDRGAEKTRESAKEEVASRADSVAAPALLDKKADTPVAPVAQRNESKAGAGPEVRSQVAAAAAPPAPAPAARDQLAPAARGGEASARVIVSPAASARWRIVSPGRVDRSIDAGTTWTMTELPAGAQVTAGASPAAGICWLVGRDGLVLRTLDGATWTRVLFPEPLTLIAVDASSAEAAIVTAESGRSFATSDGGRTWVARNSVE